MPFRDKKIARIFMMVCLFTGVFTGLLMGAPLIGTASATSFTQALKLALENNPTLAAEKNRYMATRQQQLVAFSASLPRASIFARKSENELERRNYLTDTRLKVAGEPSYKSESWGVNASMDIFTSGKNFSDYMKTRADIRAQSLSLKSTEQNTIMASVSSYLGVLTNQALLSLRKKNTVVLRRQYASVKDQFDVGVVTRTDVAQSETRLKLSQSNLIRQKASLAAAGAEYKEIIGQAPTKLKAPTTLPELPQSLEDALRLGRAHSPILLQAQEQSRSADYASYSTVAEVLPKVTLFGNYTVTENPSRLRLSDEDEVTNFGVEVTMPIFSGGRSFAAIRASRFVKGTTRSLIHAASNQVEREVTVSWYNLAAARGQIEASALQIKSAKIALAGVKQEHELGTRSILDLLDAEEEFLDAQVALIESERAQIMAAYGLLASIGGLTGDQLDLD